jgi:ABC-type branched-subunit amino acid transport system substrate-binding protein
MAESKRGPQLARAVSKGLALAGAILLSACATVVPRGPAPAPDRPAVQKPRPSRGGDAGGVIAGVPQDAERNRVALLVPLSGSNAGVGRSIANATQLALLDARSQQVRITNYDTAGGAAAAANRAIAEGAQVILGPLLADDVRAVAPIARRAGVPVISFSNDVSLGGNGTYVLGYAPSQSIARVVTFARSQGVTNFGGLVPNALYGSRASSVFLRAVEQAGGRVVSLQTYDRAPAAVTQAVTRMNKDAPFDAVLIADGSATAAAAAPLLRRASPSTRVLGTELWNSDRAVATQAALNGAWFASVPDNLYRQYAQNYRARFNAAPYRLSSLGYDAVLLVVRISRDWRVGSAFPQSRLRDADGFAGIDGAFRFGRDGVAERALEVQEVRGGTTVTVSPAPTRFDD